MSKSGSPVRMILVLPVAAIVTLGLFVAMSGVIHSEATIGNTTAPDLRDFGKPEPDAPPPPPGQTDMPDLPPPPPVEPIPTPTPDRDSIPTPDPEPPKRGNPDPGDLVSGPPTPILQFPAQYPPDCQGRGREGFATVVFDVTATGDVVNARVVDSSDRCFERAALQAIQKWKYRPTPNRSGIVASGMRQSFRFTLTE